MLKRRDNLRWTSQEEATLKIAVNKYGNKWKFILEEYPIFKRYNRTNVDLKDKWRNMNRKSPTKTVSINDEDDIPLRPSRNKSRIGFTDNIPLRHIRKQSNIGLTDNIPLRPIRKQSNIGLTDNIPLRINNIFRPTIYKIYSIEGCPYCKMAKEYLKSHGNDYEEIKVTDKNMDSVYNEIDRKTNKYRYFPMIFKNGNFIGGYGDLIKNRV